MKRLVFAVLMLCALSSAVRADFIADGSLLEWGVTPGSDWLNDIGANEWIEPVVGSGGYVGPGVGGQPFNVEAMYAYSDAANFYYAIVTGQPDTGFDYRGYHNPGDILFDLNPAYVPSDSTTPTGPFEFAVETTTYDANHAHGGKGSEGAGSFYSGVSVGLATEKWDHVYYPVEIKRSGTDKDAQATLIGQTSLAYNSTYYGSSHYVIEGVIPLSYFGSPENGSLEMSWTMTCANDMGDACWTVPEPGTLLLTGTGVLFGVGCYLRRRMK